MKKNIFYFVLLFGVFSTAQVRMTGSGLSINSVNSSAFIDASSNTTNNSSVGTGKGLVFPRVDLSTFTFVGSSGIPSNFPTRFDGMIVYNTKVGGLAGAGLTEGTLTEGYWYYYNKSNSNTGGTWKKLQNDSNIAPDSVTSSIILDGTIGAADLNSMSATSGQVLTFNGSNWAPANISEVDGIVGNEVTDAVANGGLTRSGAGTAADPYKLKINDGTANGQILVWNGTKWVAQVAPSEVDGIVGNEVTDVVANGGLTRSGTGTAADPYKLKINDGSTNGQILTWDGSKWVAQAAASYTAGSGLSLTGATFSVNDATTTAKGIVQLAGDLSGTAISPVIANNAVTSNKIEDGSILAADLNSMSATSGQVLTFNGSNWAPANTSEVDGIVGNEVTDAVANGGLTRSGAGTAADPYKLKINDGTANGQILVWNGTKWVAQVAPSEVDGIVGNEVTDAVANGGLTRSGTGTAADPYKLKINDGSTNGQILTWDGSKWVAQAAASYTAGSGLSLTGTTFSVNDATTTAKGIVQLAGDLSGTAISPVIANNAVTSNKIEDGSILAADLNSMSATSGQVLTFNGSNWTPLSTNVNITIPTTDNYTVLSTDCVIYRDILSNATITFPNTLPAGKLFYIVNLSNNKDWSLSPTPLNTTNTYIAAGSSMTIVSLGGGQIMVASGY